MKVEVYEFLHKRLNITSFYPEWQELIVHVDSWNQEERKAVASLCRGQTEYDPSSRTYRRINETLSDYTIHIVSRFVQTPIKAALLLAYTKMAPYTDQETKRVEMKSVQKELDVMTNEPRIPEIDWSCLFSYSTKDLHRNIPFEREPADRVLGILRKWKAQICKRTLFPQMSKKNISTISKNEFNTETGLGYDRVTQVDLESFYSAHGVHVTGPCEMRQRWYQSNIDPRTYYAMGGRAFELSKYVKHLFGTLCDMLPCTDRNLCVQPSRLRIDGNKDGIIYDLSSFTSNLHEHRPFIYNLATFCDGCSVTIYDSYNGYVTRDLGELLHEYNELNTNIPFSMERIYKESYIEVQRTAGLLGVYANITSAKFIHGCAILQVCKEDSYLNVAGDDGIAMHEDEDTVIDAVRTLGTMNKDRVYLLSEPGAVHLKRKIELVNGVALSGELPTLPSFEYCLKSEKCDPRYAMLVRQTQAERQNAGSSSVTSFLQSIRYLPLDRVDLLFVKHYLSEFYSWLHLPKCGSVPQISGESSFTPCILGDYIVKDPIEYTLRWHYRGCAVLSKRGIKEFDREEILDGKFECNGNAMLGYCLKMGYVESRKIKRYAYGDFGMYDLFEEYVHNEPNIFEYTIVDSHFYNVCK